MSPFVIAEAGVNHDGDEGAAHALIDAAAAAGADAVKFQAFDAARLVSDRARRAPYQRRDGQGDGQLDMLRALELPREAHRRMAERARAAGLEYLCSAFDGASLAFVADELRIERLKIGSGELDNLPFLHAHALLDRPLILSTGMGTLGEIDAALATIAHGLLRAREGGPGTERPPPTPAALRRAYASERGGAALRERVVLLHCTTEYPAPAHEINLRALGTMARAFDLPVGYSDHSDTDVAAIAAVALGATVVEKHLTLDRRRSGPDHAASYDPPAFARLVRALRETATALGSARKGPTESELANVEHVRRSVVAARDLEAGEILDAASLDLRRPGTGLRPYRLWELIGRPSRRAYRAGEPIDPD